MSLLIRNLNKSFDKKDVFTDFSFDFSGTGLYILRGDSGSGKTTLLRIIAGLDKDFTGEVIGGGISNVSFAFQEYRLFQNLNVLENTMIASKEERDDDLKYAKVLLSRLGFEEEEMNLYPDELSGGMKQRVSLVRALVKSSSILLLDEPTKELDKTLINSLYEIIKEEAAKRLVIISTHDIIPENVSIIGTINI